MLRFGSATISLIFLTVILASPSRATDGCELCGGTGTCLLPTEIIDIELQTVTETCYRDEEIVEIIKVPKTIVVPQEVPYEYTAWVRVKKEKPQTYEVKTPKFRWVDQKYMITVPGKDTITKIRKRTEQVPVTQPDGTVCLEMIEVEEPYVCEVDICVPIEKTRKVKEYFTKTETKTEKHPYTTIEPRKKTKTVTAMVPETVYEEQPIVKKVRVPYTIEKVVEVRVKRLIHQPCGCGCGRAGH